VRRGLSDPSGRQNDARLYSLPPDPPLIFDAQRQQLLERATLYARSQASAVIHIRRISISLTKVPKRCERKWCASGRFRCKVE